MIIDIVVNAIFGMDLALNFITAIYDDDYQIVDTEKVCKYIIIKVLTRKLR
jgi:hypothetical protein